MSSMGGAEQSIGAGSVEEHPQEDNARELMRVSNNALSWTYAAILLALEKPNNQALVKLLTQLEAGPTQTNQEPAIADPTYSTTLLNKKPKYRAE